MSGIEGLLRGRVLGDRYRVEEVIGRGGMGTVYRALDERLGRRVAVKVITVTGGADAESRERLRARFQREARSAAALPHHPNVVPVYDYGSDSALGLDYLVMELLRGSDLATHLARSGAPPLSTGLRILYEAAMGLAVGHRAGLIHRDVKPGNIFLTESDHHGVQVRVVDFGIAKLADDDTLAQLTQDGRTPHSPAYASPEQLRGLTQLTPASDVFSLGAVGFQLLTGERPFSEADRNRMSLGMPVPPPELRERNPAVPGTVEGIVQKALAFEPAERYADAMEMAGALERALRSLPDTPIEPYLAAPAVPLPRDPEQADEDDRTRAMEDDHTVLAPVAAPVPRPAPSPPSRARAEPPPPRRGVGGLIVWTLVLLLLVAAGFWAWTEMQGPTRVAQETDTIPPPPEELPEITPETTVPEERGTQPEIDAFVHNQEGLRLFREGDLAGALEQFQLARDLSPESAEYRYNLAVTLRRLRLFDESAQELRQVIRFDPGRAGAYYNLGLVELELGDTAAARQALQRALELSRDAAERAAATRALRAIEPAQPVPVDTMETTRPRPRPDTVARRDTARRDTTRRDTSRAGRDTIR